MRRSTRRRSTFSPSHQQLQSTRPSWEFDGDPADRLIVATAISHGAMLVTRDEQIRSSHLVRVLW